MAAEMKVEKLCLGFWTSLDRRRTFHGADEIGVREPAGSVVTFATFEPEK